MPPADPGDRTTWTGAVLDLLPIPAVLIEAGTGRVVAGNRAGRAIPVDGSTPAEDAGGRPIPPEGRPHRRAASGESFEGVEVTWTTAEGRATYLASASPAPGLPGLALLSFLDLTSCRDAEAELKRAVEARDEFFSFATHELKDPLSALLLSVEVLIRMAKRQGAVAPDVLLGRLEVSRRQGQRLATMIQNLLDVARIGHGRVRPDVEAFDLGELVLDVAARFQEPVREAGGSIEVEPSVPMIGYFDRMLLDHVVSNLVSNAVKYGVGRPVAIRLGGDEETAVLEVEDRGIGIAEGDRDRIFERFERVARGHREGSLGLGLYIVRNLVEAHGGSVSVRSNSGEGSTFVVALPRKRIPAPTPD